MTLLLFPLSSRTGKVRHVAEKLMQRNGVEAVHYWKATVRTLAEHMIRVGYPDDEADRQLREFHDAVLAELCRLQAVLRPNHGDAA
ncbi:MAG TPA: DUF6074 family protein [Pseudaminobacter sp.]|nr:DUF6074 family protein [Pseudaminobacter sp.]